MHIKLSIQYFLWHKMNLYTQKAQCAYKQLSHNHWNESNQNHSSSIIASSVQVAMLHAAATITNFCLCMTQFSVYYCSSTVILWCTEIIRDQQIFSSATGKFWLLIPHDFLSLYYDKIHTFNNVFSVYTTNIKHLWGTARLIIMSPSSPACNVHTFADACPDNLWEST